MPITINGTGSITGVTAGGLPSGSVTTANIADANITAAKLDGAQSGSAPIYAARAWVNFNGTGVVAIRASGNVSSITDNGTGDYTVNFTTALADANYSVSGSVQSESGTAVDRFFTLRGDVSITSSSYRFRTINGGNTVIDCPTVMQAIFR